MTLSPPAQDPQEQDAERRAVKLLVKLVTAIEAGKSSMELKRIIREGAPILHCNPPFESMSPESKGALVSIVAAALDQFAPSAAHASRQPSGSDRAETTTCPHGFDHEILCNECRPEITKTVDEFLSMPASPAPVPAERKCKISDCGWPESLWHKCRDKRCPRDRSTP